MKICVARAHGGIGDILMMTPGIKALKKAGHEVHVAINREPETKDSYFEILKNNPSIDRIHEYKDVEKKEFDKFVDLTSVAYPYEQAGFKLGRAKIFARYMGVSIEDETPILVLDESIYCENLIALHFFGAEKRRSWNKEKARRLINYLIKETSVNLLLLDNEYYYPDSDRIISCEGVGVMKASGYLHSAKYFIGIDSGWMHIAGALDIPGLVLFGSTDPITRIKDYKYLDGLYTKSKCRGCFYKPCEIKYNCMEEITLNEVIEVIRYDALLF